MFYYPYVVKILRAQTAVATNHIARGMQTHKNKFYDFFVRGQVRHCHLGGGCRNFLYLHFDGCLQQLLLAFEIGVTNIYGEEYTVLFAAELPKDKILLGSITNEKITYPNERQKEVFRKLKEDGILERVVRANNEGYNEQAVVSVGITKTEINEEKDLKLSVSGVAFLITRVNVVQPKKFEFGLKIDEEETKKL